MSKPFVKLFGGRLLITKKLLIIGLLIAILTIIVVVVIVLLTAPNKTSKVARGAVVTNGHGCSKIGTDILDKGGSAADAAIAALLCEGVSLPQSMGIGGGFLLTIYNSATGKVESLNSREVAPLAATENMFNGSSDLSQKGGLSVAVPAELRGYWYLYQKYGYLPWAELVQPTIDLCRNGIYVTAYLAKVMKSKKELLYSDLVLRDIFIDPTTNDTYIEGEYVKQTRLAETLTVIAQEGGDALHNGSLTEQFVKDIQEHNGIITVEDMNNYTPVWQEPIKTEFPLTNDTLYTSPLPGSGVILTFILNLLDQFLDTSNYFTSIQTQQRIIESFKWGYGRRTELGDSNFLDISNLLSNLTSKSYAEEIRKLIFDNVTSQDPLYYGANTTFVEDYGTAHLAVLAANGDAISVTSTINFLFGAGFASNSTGIILNDQMDDFSSPNVVSGFDLPPSPANYIVPGKRPVSSMVPTIILRNGTPILITGAAGGTKITTVVAQVILKHLWFGITLQDSISEKRLHHQLFPMKINYEEDFDTAYPDIVTGLSAIGHDYYFTETASGFSAVTGITAKNTIECAYDPRRSGTISYVY